MSASNREEELAESCIASIAATLLWAANVIDGIDQAKVDMARGAAIARGVSLAQVSAIDRALVASVELRMRAKAVMAAGVEPA